MCGRYTESRDIKDVALRFNTPPEQFEYAPSHNIGPGKFAPVVTQREGTRQLELMRWGLVPGWAKDEKIAFQTFNARCETVFEKPSFRSAIKRRRCLVPADGYFEWARQGGGKTPHYIYLKDRPLFSFAGIWEQWDKAPDAAPLFTFSIVTTAPNELLSQLHHRMPVILAEQAEAAWLDERTSAEALQELFAALPETEIQYHVVGQAVGSVRNDQPGLIEPVD